MNKPCAHCGDEGLLKVKYSKIPDKYVIACPSCYAHSGWYDTPEEAWDAWNRRHVETCTVVSEKPIVAAFGYETDMAEYTLSCGHTLIDESDQEFGIGGLCRVCGRKVVDG